jgi:hypothetical protein
MNRILFAGPSIWGLDLECVDQISIRPPAACGDILGAVHRGAKTIGLVDGLFGGERSVWHKEILVALSQGVRVLGASSMGALRAAECDQFGMEGVGQIYSDYRDGRRTADSDVALLHGPAEVDHQPFTLPLVDAEATIDELEARYLVRPSEAKDLIGAARRLHFSQRTWDTILRHASVKPTRSAALIQAIDAFKVELKKADAQALIARMLEARSPDGIALRAGWTLNRTLFLSALQDRVP